MYRFLICLILIALFSADLEAQEIKKQHKVDANTYKLYLSKDWVKLIDEGKKALSDGIDFYYLRMRVGMAYYYTGDYRRAEKHFRKAEQIGYKNDVLDEYIYYSLLYSGKADDAKIFGEKMNVAMQSKLGIDKKAFFDTFGFSYTYSINSETYNEPLDDLSSQNGWRNITKNYNLFSVNAGNQLGKGVKLNYQFSRLDKENFFYYKDDNYETLESSRKVNQNQFYIALSVRPTIDLELFAGGHFININTKNIGYGTADYTTSNNESLLFLGASKEMGNINIGIAAYFSNFNDNSQSQYDLSLNYFPLGNLSLYTSSILSLYSDKGDYGDRSGVVFNQKVGFKICKYLWMEAFSAFGDMNNFVVNKGTGIYNGTEIVKNYSGANFIIPFVKSGAKIFVNYSYYNNESLFSDIELQNKMNSVDFNTHSITGGVQWNF